MKKLDHPWPSHYRRSSLLVLFLSGAILLGIGCQADKQTALLQPSDSRQYRTFAVSMLPLEGSPSATTSPQRLGKVAEEAVISALTSKGYSQANPSRADLLVTLRGEFSTDGLIESAEHRTLFIEILDNQQRKRIWSDRRDRSASQSLPPELIQKMIVEMLEPFPTASKP